MSLAFQGLGRKFGRRAFRRFAVPGAAVSWAPTARKSVAGETWPLSDIGRGGLSLLTNNPLAAGSEISILVFLPKKTQPFELLGKVAYSIARGPGLTYRYRVGVEFRPFAQSEGCNPLQSLKAIEALERTYGKRKSN